jgi:hypothetical protein
MKTKRSKALFAVAGAGILCSIVLISSPSNAEQIQGQDKTGKNCERIETNGTSTFGKCQNICKDKDLTRDALNNRWVCKASASRLTDRDLQIEQVPVRYRIEF